MESTSSFQTLKVYNKINDSDLKSRELWRGLVNENDVLFEIDQEETSVKQRNVETLNDQAKIIVNSSHNGNIHQIDNSKWSKSDKDADCVHGFTNYQQLSNKHDSEFEGKTKDLQNPFFSKLLNLKSEDMLELIDDFWILKEISHSLLIAFHQFLQFLLSQIHHYSTIHMQI